jgi:hypothetical protein
LTRDRLHELFAHCADLGIEVKWCDLGSHRRGHYRDSAKSITLSHRLTRAQATACLAHECGHQKFGDTCSTPAAERRAWEYAAAFMITPEEYRTAEALVGHHPAALALELGVTPKMIEAWRRWWKTRGQFLPSECETGGDPLERAAHDRGPA